MGRPRTAALITAITAITAIVGCVALAACSSPGGPRRAEYSRAPVPGPVFYSEADRTLHVVSCGAEFHVTESARQVTIVFAGFDFPVGVADLSAAGSSCRVVNYTLSLHAPLGGRRVVDGTTGKDVPVEDVARYRSGLPEVPAPSMAAGR